MEKNTKHPDQLITSLIDTYWITIKKLAFTYVKDWGLAEDITQDVFINCYQNLGNFRGEASYKTWLFQIAVNRCRDILRNKRFKTLFIFDDLKDLLFKKEPSAEHRFMSIAEDEHLSQTILALPTKYREVIILFYYEDLSLKDMQVLLNLNLSTIKTRLKRAKALLKKQYESGDGHGR